MFFSKLKSKKIKANVTLATFVFGITFFTLCAFGVDMALIVLSRYKLQKITDYVALEYASVKMSDMQLNSSDLENSCKSVYEKYEKVYNQLGVLELMNFKIVNMSYKINSDTNEVAVKVQTTSNAMPIFLRFIGITKIIVHANSYAMSNTITMNDNSSIEKDLYRTDDETTANYLNTNGLNNKTLEFETPLITAKNTGLGDFKINFNTGETNKGGGYFIFGGYDDKGYFDMGNLVQNVNPKKVCLNSTDNSLNYLEGNSETDDKCFYCVNAKDTPELTFDLSKETEVKKEGLSKRINKIKIFQAISPSKTYELNGYTINFDDPCNPDMTNFKNEESEDKNKKMKTASRAYYDEQETMNVDAVLTILNNSFRINKTRYDNFSTSGENTTGHCEGKGENNGF